MDKVQAKDHGNHGHCKEFLKTMQDCYFHTKKLKGDFFTEDEHTKLMLEYRKKFRAASFFDEPPFELNFRIKNLHKNQENNCHQ